MLLCEFDPRLFLLTASDMAAKKTDRLSLMEFLACQKTLKWAESYLCRSHPELGRKGDVCPFVKSSMNKYQTFYLTCCQHNNDMDTAVDIIRSYKKWFLELESLESKKDFKTITICFPGVSIHETSEFVDTIQKHLKPEFVSEGLMLGQFYPSCKEPGLHNELFCPLISPVPLLVIRYMQLTDLAFLVDKPEYIKDYCKKFDIENKKDLDKAIHRINLEKLPKIGVNTEKK